MYEPPFYSVEEGDLDETVIEDFIFHYVCYQMGFEPQSSQNNEMVMAKVSSIMELVPLGICLSHYYWILWAIYMSKNPEVDFDYIGFAEGRYQKYLKAKKKLKLWFMFYQMSNYIHSILRL